MFEQKRLVATFKVCVIQYDTLQSVVHHIISLQQTLALKCQQLLWEMASQKASDMFIQMCPNNSFVLSETMEI